MLTGNHERMHRFYYVYIYDVDVSVGQNDFAEQYILSLSRTPTKAERIATGQKKRGEGEELEPKKIKYKNSKKKREKPRPDGRYECKSFFFRVTIYCVTLLGGEE
jgi:hypothetical protein